MSSSPFAPRSPVTPTRLPRRTASSPTARPRRRPVTALRGILAASAMATGLGLYVSTAPRYDPAADFQILTQAALLLGAVLFTLGLWQFTPPPSRSTRPTLSLTLRLIALVPYGYTVFLGIWLIVQVWAAVALLCVLVFGIAFLVRHH